MALRGTPPDEARQAQLRAEIRRDREERLNSYRDRALKLFPHVCARCAREFSGRRLKELTVHHKDHDHTNNPPDGGNWELLCLYCHDNEHEKGQLIGHYDGARPDEVKLAPSIFSPFEGLESLLPEDKEDQKS